MLKFLLAAAPYLLKAPNRNSHKQVARSFTALVLFAFSGLALCAAIFIYVTSLYGAALGFTSVSALLLIAGLAIFAKAKTPKGSNSGNLPAVQSSDPVAALVPDAVMEDPTVKRLMTQVAANPVATSLAAAAIGMLITREFMKD